jgi:hypothetical protein
MSLVSRRYHRWRSSVIIAGECVVSLERVATSAVVSLCSMTLRPVVGGGRLDYVSHRAQLLPCDMLLAVLLVP